MTFFIRTLLLRLFLNTCLWQVQDPHLLHIRSFSSVSSVNTQTFELGQAILKTSEVRRLPGFRSNF